MARLVLALLLLAGVAAGPALAAPPKMLFTDNSVVRVGIDAAKGGAITWLSWKDYPKNAVNLHDPGRLIQQSYYAGKSLDRTADGQARSWSPWAWNPVQAGGVSSWARATQCQESHGVLYSQSVPKLWDMPDEQAAAQMRQWTGFEPGMPDVVVVRCELLCQRSPADRWGPAVRRPQEVPACYFTRNFSRFESYLGQGQWRHETHAPGPPWGLAKPPLQAMACFDASGQGIALFSPCATLTWAFGPVGPSQSHDPTSPSCVHLSPHTFAALGPRSTYRYRYWIIVGTQPQLARRIEALRQKYGHEKAELTNPPNPSGQ